VQQPGRALPADMSAPITPAALETCSAMARGGGPARFVGSTDGTEPPAPAIVPAAALAGVQDTAAGMSPARRSTAPPPNRREVLPAAIRGPVSRSEMKAGAISAAGVMIGVIRLCGRMWRLCRG